MSSVETVLVVDDDDDLRDVVTVTLQRPDRRIVEAVDGQDALAHIRANGVPDLILLDMNMPVMNGWEFARVLRAEGLWSAPVIVVTAAHSAERSAIEIGAAGFLGKPFDTKTLRSTVAAALEATPGAEPALSGRSGDGGDALPELHEVVPQSPRR